MHFKCFLVNLMCVFLLMENCLLWMLPLNHPLGPCRTWCVLSISLACKPLLTPSASWARIWSAKIVSDSFTIEIWQYLSKVFDFPLWPYWVTRHTHDDCHQVIPIFPRVMFWYCSLDKLMAWNLQLLLVSKQGAFSEAISFMIISLWSP